MPNDIAHTVPQAGPAITVQGLTFPLPEARYHEGHVCTAPEASALNQTFAENLRNNFASKLKAKLELVAKDLKPEDIDPQIVSDLRAEFLEYAASYTFGFRTPRVILDPVEHEARKLAKQTVLSALRQKSIDSKTVSPDQMDHYVSTLLEKRPELRKEAARRIKAQKAVNESVFAELDLGGESEAQAAE